jgi:Cu-processing system ATP-binding protein
MIEIKHIQKKFGRLIALNDVNLSFEAGETIALIGPNGSGKTTLIKTILGLVIPDSGDVLFKGKSVLGEWNYRERIGYMPQIGRYPDNMRIGQIIDMMVDLRKNHVNGIDDELLNDLGVSKLLDKPMRTLSGGTRQKVSACLAFMFQPDVLILDEPTAGLDPLSSEILKAKMLKGKEAGKLILITSHILSDLDDLVTEVVYMQEGLVRYHEALDVLQHQTGEQKLNKVIAALMHQHQQVML